ncbi:MAG: GHKL domain-containing protein [Ilumatobacter sp.]|uniref:ATP-binding protein n=1 Tax=Ilumatobacter sp. TaxID=1967498 RepID=UPI003751AD51|nr:GHKL domain-containing protein [Ilumatobacter sp.]MBT6444002.1 GHKL domain-containing protein [Acidimicrobiaceae bacterium]
MSSTLALLIGVALGVALGLFLARRAVGHARDGRARTGLIAESITGPIPPPVDVERETDAELARGLRSAVDRLQMGVVMCDASLKTTYRNASANALNGTHGGVIIDAHLQQLFAETQSGEPAGSVFELQGPPKTTYSIEAMPVPHGGAVATIDDISERVRIDSMRTDFVANISHELKTPVGAIAVLAEMLADEPDVEVISALSTRVVDESHRAARTIDDLLELSRIESSHRLDDAVDLAEVVAEAVTRGRMVADGRRVEVESIEVTEAVWIRADRRQLSSAIGNLVENAVKYSDDGALVQVRIRRNERWVEVMVADQGVGIPAADIDRVFERFYRVDKARARETGGTGLGLAIVRHVANNHGGVVSVQSQEGEGSTFAFRLPARLIEPANTSPAASQPTKVSPTDE